VGLHLLPDLGNTPGHVDKVIADWSEVGDALSGFTER